MYRTKVKGKILKLDNGRIVYNGLQVGSVLQRLQHGYHPSIEVKVGDQVVWLEQDTPNLEQKIVSLVVKQIKGRI